MQPFRLPHRFSFPSQGAALGSYRDAPSARCEQYKSARFGLGKTPERDSEPIWSAAAGLLAKARQVSKGIKLPLWYPDTGAIEETPARQAAFQGTLERQERERWIESFHSDHRRSAGRGHAYRLLSLLSNSSKRRSIASFSAFNCVIFASLSTFNCRISASFWAATSFPLPSVSQPGPSGWPRSLANSLCRIRHGILCVPAFHRKGTPRDEWF